MSSYESNIPPNNGGKKAQKGISIVNALNEEEGRLLSFYIIMFYVIMR